MKTQVEEIREEFPGRFTFSVVSRSKDGKRCVMLMKAPGHSSTFHLKRAGEYWYDRAANPVFKEGDI